MQAKMTAVAMALMLIGGTLTGCKKGEDAQAKGDKAAMDPGEKSIMEMGQDDLKAAKEKADKGEDPMLDCTTALSHAESLGKSSHPEVKKYVAEANKVCGRDVPLKWAEALVKKITAKPKKDQFDIPIGDCASLKTTMDELAKRGHGDDAAVKALAKPYDERCEIKK